MIDNPREGGVSHFPPIFKGKGAATDGWMQIQRQKPMVNLHFC